MQYLSLDEIHREETNILKNIVQFCMENNITYYLAYGTLLGAIRHKGFIPWDDDIDIMMPRPDYDKFQKLVEEKNICDNYIVKSYEKNNLQYPFCKVMNTKIQIAEESLENKLANYLWVDIFPMDGVPNDIKEHKKHIKKMMFIKKIFMVCVSEKAGINMYAHSKLDRIIKYTIKFLFGSKKNIEKMLKKIDSLAKKYDYEKSNYVSVITLAFPKERVDKNKINDYKVEFEGMQLNAMSCYDVFLTQVYGDYMQLPPVEKRANHHLKVYWVE